MASRKILIKGAMTPASLIFLLFLASTCLFRATNAYPHIDLPFGLDMQTTALQGSQSLVSDRRRIEPSKRQDENPCEDAPCDHSLSEDTGPPPSPPKPHFVDPPGNLRCEPAPTASEKYQDAHYRRVKASSGFFCKNLVSSILQDYTMTPIVKSVSATESGGGNFLFIPLPSLIDDVEEWQGGEYRKGSDVFDFRLEVVPDCRPFTWDPVHNSTKLNLAKPVRHNSCKHILSSAWKQCNNRGRGGSLQAGCLRYSIHAHF